jgi:hypothetical protein
MGEKVLVESKIPDTIRLIEKLDTDGNSPSLAVWYFYNDVDEWRLLIAGSAFDALLPKQESIAYKKIIEAIASLSLASLSISDLKLVSTNSPLPQALRTIIRTNPTGIAQAHFTDTTLNGIFMKEFFVLRSA